MEDADGIERRLTLSLKSSSTAFRISELKALHERVSTSRELKDSGTAVSRANDLLELSDARLRTINTLLWSTYPAYSDRASRQGVQSCLRAIWRQSLVSFADFVTLFQAEALKAGLASSNVLVLIEWGALALQECRKSPEQWEQYGISLVTAHSQLLELLTSIRPKAGTKKSGLVVTRQALRNLFRHESARAGIIETIVLQLSAKSPLGYKNAVMLGVVAGVCAHMQQPAKAQTQQNGVVSSPRAVLEGLKNHYYSFWVREVVGCKTLVSGHIANAFHDFFADFTTLEDLEKEVVPALEKALLRAPEVVLNDLISPLINPLPLHLDLSDILANRLLKPLLSNLKSANAAIRDGALRAFGTLLKRCKNDNSLEMIMNEILKPLTTSKVPSAEQRIVSAKVLEMLPSSISRSTQICSGLAGMVLKEPNEAAVSVEASAMTVHLVMLMPLDQATTELILATISKGLGDKKPTLQRIWALNVGKLLWALRNGSNAASSAKVVDTVLPKMIDLYNEVVMNPVSAGQSGSIVIAYILTSLHSFLKNVGNASCKALLSKAAVIQQALMFDPKPSFLLNYRVYTKLVTEVDLTWFVRALAECFTQALSQGQAPNVCTALVQAWLYTIASSAVHYEVRRQATGALSRQYQQLPAETSHVVVEGLWVWLRNFKTEIKDSAAYLSQITPTKLLPALHAICPPAVFQDKSLSMLNSKVLEDQLIDLLVLCHPAILPATSWIDICLEMAQDPGSLVNRRTRDCLDKVSSVLRTNDASDRPLEAIKVAAYSTYAELAFVASSSVLPLLVDQIKSDLDLGEFSQCSPTDFAIARTPEGTTFIDVLNKKGPNEALDKGSSDYELLKWEADVRAQQAARYGQQKKLTADDQAKINTQLSKEADIRKRVRHLECQLQRGFGTIRALALGPPTNAELWMGYSLKVLIDIIQAGVGLLVDESAAEAFIACANLVTIRLGPLRQFIGVATLRSLGSSHLPEYLLQESLGGGFMKPCTTKANCPRSCDESSLSSSDRWRTATLRCCLIKLYAATCTYCTCEARHWA